jgi:hypothetical protein
LIGDGVVPEEGVVREALHAGKGGNEERDAPAVEAAATAAAAAAKG